MKSLIVIAAVTVLVAGRPELYREKEDFQYSRSSTDEGTKSGYYDAQKGNMGGNYERAHNMDGLAQHQMSGLIQQTEGELGDAAKMRTGSVYTAANSRGTYGSGRYNLNNLEGRNFQEGVSYGDSQSQSSQRNSAFRQHSSGSNSYSNRYSHSSGQSSSQQSEHQGHDLQSSNMQDNLYRQQDYSGYSGTSGLSHTFYPQSRLVNTRPVRIMIRPGSRVSVPVATQTYNADHRASSYDSSSYDHNSAKSDIAQTYNADQRASSYDSSSYDHNAAKSDAEVIINDDRETNSRYPKNKHYEQSYSYRKEWEKHDTSPEVAPLSIPTESSLHVGSQLYDNSQMYNTRDHYQRYGANSHNNQYVKTASNSQGRYRSNHKSEQESLSSDSDSNTHTNAAHHSVSDADYIRQLANGHTSNTNSMPQSYQSSYSYHKSWERQGDPYVIVPVPNGNQNGQTSERMTASNAHNTHSSHHYGSQHKQLHQSYSSSNGLDCENDDEGHIRVARSYNANDEYAQQNQQFEQAQNGWENSDQQTQDQWGKFLEDSQNKEDLGQQTENKWDKNEDLGQQPQNSWDKVEDLSQQTNNKWDKIEDLGQQTQNKWDKIEDLGQQSQNSWDKFENLGQQSQNKWDNLDLGQQSQNSWDKVEDLSQQTNNKWDKIEDLGQQTQNSWDKIEGGGQHTQNKWQNIENLNQQSQTQWDGLNQYGQEYQSNTDQHQNTWDQSEQSEIHTNSNNYGSDNFLLANLDQKFQDNWDLRDQIPQNPESFQSQNNNEQETIGNTDTSRITPNATQDFTKEKNSTDLWDKMDAFGSFFNNSEILNSDDKNFSKPQDLDDKTTFYDKHTTTDWKNANNEDHIIPPNNFYDETQLQNNSNSDGHSQFDFTYSNSWDNVSSLNNFWNKMDSFEHKSPKSFDIDAETSSNSDLTRNHFTYSSQDVYYQKQNKSHSAHNTNQHNQLSTTNIDMQSNNNYSEITSTTMKDHDNNVTFPQDLDRGDIGVDEFEIETISTSTQKNLAHSEFNTFQINNYKYKTPEEIEALSLTKDNNVSDVSVLGISNKTHDINDGIPKPIELSTEEGKSVETKKYEQEKTPAEINHQIHDQNQNLHQQNIDHNSEYFGQDIHDLNRQNLDQSLENFGQHSQDLHQQNMEQNFEDFQQHSQDLHQQNMEQNFEGFDQHSQDLHQQNMAQNLEDFGQNSEDLHQQNMEQNLENFGQHSQDFHRQNMEQNLEDFGQHSQDLHQQNMEQNFEDFGQHSQNLQQRNMEQNMEDFGQLTQELHQQNIEQNWEHFRQQDVDQKHNTDQNSEINVGSNSNGEFNKQDFLDIRHQPQNLIEEEMIQKTENKPLYAENFRNNNKNNDNAEDQKARNLDQFDIPHNQAPHLQNLNTQLVEENHLTSTTPAAVTEKPGFWSSVGNKLSRAKDKVASWFRST